MKGTGKGSLLGELGLEKLDAAANGVISFHHVFDRLAGVDHGGRDHGAKGVADLLREGLVSWRAIYMAICRGRRCWPAGVCWSYRCGGILVVIGDTL